MFLSFVHDIPGIRVIGGYSFGCGGVALGNPRVVSGFLILEKTRKKNHLRSI